MRMKLNILKNISGSIYLENEEEELLCSYCNGSGLGMHEGSGNCEKCKGRGTEKIDDE